MSQAARLDLDRKASADLYDLGVVPHKARLALEREASQLAVTEKGAALCDASKVLTAESVLGSYRVAPHPWILPSLNTGEANWLK
jgi:hypothetical protein